jgi:hypothetical protein
MITHTDLSSAFFLHLFTPIDFRSFSVQSNHLNFGLPAFLLQSGFPRYTSFTVLSSDILTRWPARSSLHTFTVVTIFGFLHITCNLSLVRILQAFWSFIGHHTKYADTKPEVSGHTRLYADKSQCLRIRVTCALEFCRPLSDGAHIYPLQYYRRNSTFRISIRTGVFMICCNPKVTLWPTFF